MNMFIVDLKKYIASSKFFIGIIIMVLLCLLANAPLVSARDPLSVMDEIVRMRKDVWLDQGTQFCFENIWFNFDNSLWYVIVLPIIAAFPVVYTFSDEWFGDNYIMTLSRCGYGKYTFSKCASAFATGFLTAACGIAVFGIITAGVFPSLSDFGDGEKLLYDHAYNSFWHSMLAKAVNHALVCGIYACAAVLVCLILKDKFFTLSIFMVINYFSKKLEIKYMLTKDMSVEKNRALRALFPSCQTSLHSVIPDNMHISFYWYALFTAVFCTFIGVLSYFIIRRRYKYAA